MRASLLLLAALAGGARAEPFLPSRRLDFGLSADAITDSCRAGIERAEMALREIVARPDAAKTFANTVEALDQALFDLQDAVADDTFLKHVSVSSATRAAANDCETALGQFTVEVFSREDLFAAVSTIAARREPLEPEPRKLLDKTILDFKRSGLLKPLETREAVKSIRKRIVDLEAQFSKNLNEVKDFLLLTRPELEGLPPDYIERLERFGDKYKVTVEYPDYFPFMDNASNTEARRKLESLYNNRAAAENLPLLRELLRLREEAARLLGYATHAHFVIEDRMAKKPERVDAFLKRLAKRLKPLGRRELQQLLALEKEIEGPSSDGVISAWDWRYYDNLLMKRRHEIDKEAIKEYFPLEVVTEGMLAVYQKLLALRFRRVPDAAVWHKDVSLYEITDASGGSPLGYFYMDLFPREGKYKHAAAFTLIQGRRLIDGRYQVPVAAMVANFSRPGPGKPSLLKHGEHEEVETYFHEFGHIMHQTLTRAAYGRFSGANTARDFVEAPSQMLENWVWDPAVLDALSGHYADRSRKLPPELLRKMIAAKNHDVALRTLRQLFFGSIDLHYHTREVQDTTQDYREHMRRIALIPMSEDTHPEASFGHLVGYDAGYYGYLWSQVFAEDMFSRFRAEGLLNPAIGRRYRETILERGSSKDEEQLLRDFLGREPSEDAFIKSLGFEE